MSSKFLRLNSGTSRVDNHLQMALHTPLKLSSWFSLVLWPNDSPMISANWTSTVMRLSETYPPSLFPPLHLLHQIPILLRLQLRLRRHFNLVGLCGQFHRMYRFLALIQSICRHGSQTQRSCMHLNQLQMVHSHQLRLRCRSLPMSWCRPCGTLVISALFNTLCWSPLVTPWWSEVNMVDALMVFSLIFALIT